MEGRDAADCEGGTGREPDPRDAAAYRDRGLPVVDLAGDVDEPPEHDAFAMVVAIRAPDAGPDAGHDLPVHGDGGPADGGAPFLLVRNTDPGRGWELPGGKVEAGEGYPAAACREFREETGFRLDALEPIAVLDETWVSDERSDDVVGVAFRGRVGERVGEPEGKIAEVAWWRALPDDLTAITFTRATFRRLVALAREAGDE